MATTMAGGSADYSDNVDAPPRAVLHEMFLDGVNASWYLAASTAIGVALMCTRFLLGTSDDAANNDHLIGSLVITFSIMAMGEVARPLRFVNIGFGAWLIASPWLVDGYSGVAAAASVLLGALLIWLALPLGRIEGRYGAWDKIARFTLVSFKQCGMHIPDAQSQPTADEAERVAVAIGNLRSFGGGGAVACTPVNSGRPFEFWIEDRQCRPWKTGGRGI
jgi:hypothetical protein